MLSNNVIDGRAIAEKIYQELSAKIEKIIDISGQIPTMALLSATDDAGVKFYQNTQVKIAQRLKIKVENYLLSSSSTEEELTSLIEELNKRKDVHGIFIHFPLPVGINEKKIASLVSPDKDLDGIHPLNQGKLFAGEKGTRPCTPSAVIELLERQKVELSGKHAVVIGRSVVVGKPLALALLEKNCTVTICHSKTANLREITKQADILAVAIGKPNYIDSSFIKPGAIVIDVGTNEVEGKMIGDVDFAEAVKIASLITPVPGGVGPVTTALCFKNLVRMVESVITPSI
ncbi:MAG TPA: bifunctional 5,10-methylenetetrahydrofolate dehydrogenase/5,10-methenyltetrahydrofolate cyclohydrolase [Clostridia bacterium]|nr:bifunctional 5,10-methylenetetrahydrofolate dehydrogenase/5,10-methenyltetrahydrofolate cyclohydrolase [Clostridia bacterium]